MKIELTVEEFNSLLNKEVMQGKIFDDSKVSYDFSANTPIENKNNEENKFVSNAANLIELLYDLEKTRDKLKKFIEANNTVYFKKLFEKAEDSISGLISVLKTLEK